MSIGRYQRRYQKGIIPLAILGVGFLLASVIGITAVASNPNLSLSVSSWAKAKQKTWRDRGSPALRHAGKVAEENATRETYNAQKNALENVDVDSLSDSERATYDALKAKIDQQSLLNESESSSLAQLPSSDISLNELIGNESGTNPFVGDVAIPAVPASSPEPQKTDITLNEFLGNKPGTNPFVGSVSIPAPAPEPQKTDVSLNEFIGNESGTNPFVGNVTIQPPSRTQTLTPEQLQAQSYAQRRALADTTLTTTTIAYEPDPNLASNMNIVETVITRDLATGSIIDTETKKTTTTKDATKLGTTGTNITFEEKTSSETKPAGLLSFSLGGTKYEKVQTDTYVQKDEKGNVISTYVKQYNVSADGQKQENKIGEFITNLGYKIAPPKGTKSLDESQHTVGDTWIAKDASGEYVKYVKDAVGSHIDTSFQPKVETVVGRTDTTTIIKDADTGEIIQSSTKPNEVPLYKIIGNFISRVNQNEPEKHQPGEVWIEKNPAGPGYVRNTQLSNGGVKEEVFVNTSVEPAVGPKNDALVITDANTGESIGQMVDAERAEQLRKINEKSAPKVIDPKIYPANSTIVEKTTDLLGGRLDRIIQTNQEGQVVDRSYAYYTKTGAERSRFEQTVSNFINWIYNQTLPR